MRCLSPHARYSIQVFETDEKLVTDTRGYASMQALKKGIVANFDKLGLLAHEEAEALSKFNFSGLPEGVDPRTRIGVFDTEAYCLDHYDNPEERQEMQVQMEVRLRELQKKFPTHYIIVDEPVAPKPWPTYDEDGVEDILKFQERLQVPAELVRRYEEENSNRPEIVDPLRAIEEQHAEQVIEVVA